MIMLENESNLTQICNFLQPTMVTLLFEIINRFCVQIFTKRILTFISFSTQRNRFWKFLYYNSCNVFGR